MSWHAALIIPLFVLAAPVSAQQSEPNCPPDAEPLPAGLAGWNARTSVNAVADAGGLGKTTLAVGKAVNLALSPASKVRYALSPEKAAGSASSGGMIGFTVERPGTYRVALGAAAWIDMVRDGKAAKSVGHGHGPACSGIRKMVDFSLQPGRYVLQISGNAAPAVALMVVRMP